jgi:2-dehydropantoate 2-reductase
VTTRILLAGAGAVGQVFGRHLAAGGADVDVLVRPRHAPEAARGYRLHRVGLVGERRAERFRPRDVLTDPQDARGRRYDQAWLCVPTTALDPAWIRAIGQSTEGATVVSLQPGLGVRRRIAAEIADERIVQGIITFLAWPTPLEGSADPRERAAESDPGTAYLVPPIPVVGCSGPRERRVLDVVGALRRGGMPADRARDVEADMAVSTALLMPMIAALEIAGWSMTAFRAGDAPDLAAGAARETLAVASAVTGKDTALQALALRAPLLKLGAALGPRFAPLDLETYLRVHFTKVGAQTRVLLAGYRARAVELGLPHERMDAVVRRLGP